MNAENSLEYTYNLFICSYLSPENPKNTSNFEGWDLTLDAYLKSIFALYNKGM